MKKIINLSSLSLSDDSLDLYNIVRRDDEKIDREIRYDRRTLKSLLKRIYNTLLTLTKLQTKCKQSLE